MNEDAVAEHEEACKACEIERTEKKFAKENEKLAEEGKDTQGDDVLRSRLRAVEDEFTRLEKERGMGKATIKRDKAPEKLVEEIDVLEEKIKAFKLQMVDREAGKWKSGCPTTLKQGGDSKGTDRNRNDLSIQALKRWFYA